MKRLLEAADDDDSPGVLMAVEVCSGQDTFICER